MPSVPLSVARPDPGVIFDALNGYQRSAALKAAIELDLFSEISRGNHTVKEIAASIGATQRGVRILCDFLVIHNLLSKEGDRYSLTINSATFLDRNSPAWFGSVIGFMLDPRLTTRYDDLAKVIRDGMRDEGAVSHENPIWVEFAKHMAPMIYPAAMDLAEMVAGDKPIKVLDIAAGHGLFGIAVAQRNSQARITGLDWPSVLAVARENAQKFGMAERYSTIEGSAFEVDFGGPYDLVLVPNFFHHFDREACESIMRKVFEALVPGGLCATLEFVPDDDRVSPPVPAGFAMAMLGSTPKGDAYTFAEYESMLRNAGFVSFEQHPAPRAPQTIILSRRA